MKKLFFSILLLCSIFSSYLNAEEVYIEPPRFLIKIPTRSRPKQFFEFLDLYYQKLSGKILYHFLITCDDDDASMNNPEVIQRLRTYPNLTFRFSKNSSKIDAYNKDVSSFIENYNIILVASDDMKPVQDNYDLFIAQCMIKNFPNYDGVLHFLDGCVNDSVCNTYPVIGNKFYLRFGYIYYPGYSAFYCDNEISDISRQMGKEKMYNIIILKHMYQTNPSQQDSLYKKNITFWDHDQELFKERKKFNYFLSQN